MLHQWKILLPQFDSNKGYSLRDIIKASGISHQSIFEGAENFRFTNSPLQSLSHRQSMLRYTSKLMIQLSSEMNMHQNSQLERRVRQLSGACQEGQYWEKYDERQSERTIEELSKLCLSLLIVYVSCLF